MRGLALPVLALLVLGLAACGKDAPAPSPLLGVWTVDPATIPLPPGMRVPPPGLGKRLELRPDGTFRLSALLRGEVKSSENGRWSVEGSRLHLEVTAVNDKPLSPSRQEEAEVREGEILFTQQTPRGGEREMVFRR